jgi:DHA1 family inner membrane transport protein
MGPDVPDRASVGPVQHSRPVVVLALAALALGGFAIGTTEFVAAGLLPDIARELLPRAYALSSSAAIAQAGILVSAYAAGVVVGAPVLAAATARLPRKTVLLGLLVVFVLATVATTVLPGFGLVVAARFIAGLPHGAYFGIATVAASELLGPGRRGQAASSVLLGLTIANVVGVPAVTAIGQAAGWRVAFLVVAAAFALTFVAVLIAVPKGPGDPAATIGKELRAFARVQVWFAVALGAIGFGGLFSAYTYVAPITTDVTGLSASAVPVVLVVFGVGMTVGNIASGRFVDRGVRRAVIAGFAGTLVALVVLLVGAHTAVGLFAGVFLTGVFAAVLGPAIQVRLMDVAAGSTTIAAASTHSALNTGNSLGAALGAVAIAAGLGYLSPIAVGIGVTAIGLGTAGVAFGLEHRGAGRAAAAPTPGLTAPEV